MWQPEKKNCNESVYYLTLSPLLSSKHSLWMTAYTFYACASVWYRRLSGSRESFCYLCIKSQSSVRLTALRLERLCQNAIILKQARGKSTQVIYKILT
jgi:hypothetical protein